MGGCSRGFGGVALVFLSEMRRCAQPPSLVTGYYYGPKARAAGRTVFLLEVKVHPTKSLIGRKVFVGFGVLHTWIGSSNLECLVAKPTETDDVQVC